MMLIHHILPSPRHSHTSSISSFWVGKLGREMKTRLNRARPTTRRRRGARLARERETERERERESDGVFGRACQLGLPAMFAQGGLQLRVSSGREKREREREIKRFGALPGVTLRGAPPDARRKRDSSTDHRLLDFTDYFFLLCVSQRGRGELVVQAISVPSFGFQGSPSGGRLLGVPCCCVEGSNHPGLHDGDTAVRFRAFHNLVDTF